MTRLARRLGSFPAIAVVTASAIVTSASHAIAAPIKVACIGEHTTHSHHFAPLNREAQPAGMQEYPAMLQTQLGAGYQVRNFGDCCATVIQGYTPQETHPYVLGALSAAEGPGYDESLAFAPDVVVIGSWGRHDWGLAKATTATWNLSKFEADYEDLIHRYQALPSHPIIFVSLPIPIPNGQGTPATGVATSSVVPSVRNIAAKYNLPVVDLYTPFLNHADLFKQPPDAEGEGEHVTDGPGLHAIADAVYAAIVAYRPADAGTGDASADGGPSVATDAADGARPPSEDAVLDVATTPDGSASGAGGLGGSGGAAGSNAGSAGSAINGGGSAGSANGGAANGGSGGAATAGSPSQGADPSGCACSFVNARRTATAPAASLVVALAWLARRKRRCASVCV